MCTVRAACDLGSRESTCFKHNACNDFRQSMCLQLPETGRWRDESSLTSALDAVDPWLSSGCKGATSTFRVPIVFNLLCVTFTRGSEVSPVLFLNLKGAQTNGGFLM